MGVTPARSQPGDPRGTAPALLPAGSGHGHQHPPPSGPSSLRDPRADPTAPPGRDFSPRYSLAGVPAALPAPLQGGGAVLQQRQQAAPQQEVQQLPDALGEVQDGLGHPGLELGGREGAGVGELRRAPGSTGARSSLPTHARMARGCPSCWVHARALWHRPARPTLPGLHRAQHARGHVCAAGSVRVLTPPPCYPAPRGMNVSGASPRSDPLLLG